MCGRQYYVSKVVSKTNFSEQACFRRDTLRKLLIARPILGTVAPSVTQMKRRRWRCALCGKVCLRCHQNESNNNNSNNYDNVYGAIIMTKVIARVHPVHLMNVD